ncbi:cyclopropane-fatty-acyl-phospholipid synthase family protein [soil metagenome]
MVRSNADRLASVVSRALGVDVPIRIRAWDCSEHGPPDAPTVVVHSRRALRHLVWQPGELGLARAYVSGDLDIEGDLTDALRSVWNAGATRPGPRRLVGALAPMVRLGALGRRPSPPAAEARLGGALHTRERDHAAISHHYDLSNEFYELLLDDSMAYSCGYWTNAGNSDGPGGLATAQRGKLDLVCRKLALTAGAHLVDIGCGWGSLTLHAAQHYGARVTAVTLSNEQRDFVATRAAERGVADRVDVSLTHYRDLDVTSADAVATIEIGEHVGTAEYAHFATTIHSLLRPCGRALVQQMSRRNVAPGGGAFIETYIAPDMHMQPLHETISHLEEAHLEIRHVEAMREHYPRTVAAWAENLERRWRDAVDLVGEQVARVWRLYLAGGALPFEQNRMGVDQVLAVRPDEHGDSGMPATPAEWAHGQ